MKLTMTAFQQAVAEEKEANFLVVAINVRGGAMEQIVIDRDSLKIKMDYYAKVYDENLKMIANPAVSIISYVLVKDVVLVPMDSY